MFYLIKIKMGSVKLDKLKFRYFGLIKSTQYKKKKKNNRITNVSVNQSSGE